jgi:hypothetical protein
MSKATLTAALRAKLVALGFIDGAPLTSMCAAHADAIWDDGPGGGGGIGYTTTTAGFTMPGVGSAVTVAVTAGSASVFAGQPVFISTAGFFTAAASGADAVALTNLGYTGNASPGAVIASGVMVVPSGIRGEAGAQGPQGIQGPVGPAVYPTLFTPDAHTLAMVTFRNLRGDGDVDDAVVARGAWTAYADAAQPQWMQGPFGLAMRNGTATTSKKGFRLASGLWRPTTGITLAAWVWPVTSYTSGSFGRVINKFYQNDTWTTGSYWSAGMDFSSANLRGGINTDAGFFSVTTAHADKVPQRQWSHVVFTYDFATLKLYMNGQLEASALNAAASFNWGTDGDWFIGQIPVSVTHEQWPGGCDGIRIDGVARSAAEIRAEYRLGMGWTA